MSQTQTFETLMCIGGPLSTRRISVPAGLRWFTLEECDTKPGGSEQTDVIAFSSLHHVTDSSDSTPLGAAEFSPRSAYVRTQFISGENGLTEIFKFHKAWTGGLGVVQP